MKMFSKHSSESIRKIKKNRKGKNLGYRHPSIGKKISAKLKGLPKSVKHRAKMSAAHTGTKKPWISERQRGSKSNFWKGGRYTLTTKIYNSYEYNLWRKEVFERDNWTCQECGQRGNRLEAHHIKQRSVIVEDFLSQIKNVFEMTVDEQFEILKNCKELWKISNGKTLCKECHCKTDSYLKKLN